MKTTNQKSLQAMFEDVSMAVDPNIIHVVPYEGKWKVRKEGATRAIFVEQYKKNAISKAVKIKSKGKADRVVVHNKMGQFEYTL